MHGPIARRMFGWHVSNAAVSTACVVVLCAATTVASAAPQPQGLTTGPTFEVVSVKPAEPLSLEKAADARVEDDLTEDGALLFAGLAFIGDQGPQGNFRATSVTTRALILRTYKLRGNQLEGGPGWLASDRFTIAAKAPVGMRRADVEPMVKAMLADRFKLRTHVETRQLPVETLVLARHDGSLGPQLRPGAADCATRPVVKSQPPPCASRGGGGRIIGESMSMATLAGYLMTELGRTVVDGTGLTGNYHVEMVFAAEKPIPGFPPDTTSPSLRDALREQLGLTLETRKGPVNVMIIDAVEKPSPN